jgi:Ca2+-binding EF-hand superfamily protein
MIVRLSLLAAATLIASAASSQAPKQVSKAEFTKNIDARFAAIDTNKDGELSKAEIAAAEAKALQKVQAAEQKRMEVEFGKLDTNHDHQLSLAEFKAGAPAPRIAQSPDKMLAALDTNKDGKISAAEYRAPKVANFDKADTNHDGILTAQEIAAARRK